MIIIKIIWLFLPAALANMMPVIMRRINFLNIALSPKFFGPNKTYRGFFWGILGAIVLTYLQSLLYVYDNHIFLINYRQINIYLFGFLMGGGALLGDLTKSFWKRRLKIKPGKAFLPFDQMDWIIFTNIVLLFYMKFSFLVFFWSLLIFTPLHFLVNLIAYQLKIRNNKL